jgi:hypothetical protein
MHGRRAACQLGCKGESLPSVGTIHAVRVAELEVLQVACLARGDGCCQAAVLCAAMQSLQASNMQTATRTNVAVMYDVLHAAVLPQPAGLLRCAAPTERLA